MWPHASPSTTIGAPAAEPTPTLRPASTGAPAMSSATSSIRIGWPVRMCSFIATSDGSSHGQLEPAGNGFGPSPQVPATVTLPSCSQRKIWTSRGRSSCATSRAMAANTSADAAPVATSTATRRSDACCSARAVTEGALRGNSEPGTSGV